MQPAVTLRLADEATPAVGAKATERRGSNSKKRGRTRPVVVVAWSL